jgi:hypothetical protein
MRAYETTRSKKSDLGGMGSLDFTPDGRWGGPTGRHSLKFFFELQDTKSPLLDFQSRGHDKWRIIHAWLLDADRVSDMWVAAPRIVPSRRPRIARDKSRAKI